jgi:hypothetical protein
MQVDRNWIVVDIVLFLVAGGEGTGGTLARTWDGVDAQRDDHED